MTYVEIVYTNMATEGTKRQHSCTHSVLSSQTSWTFLLFLVISSKLRNMGVSLQLQICWRPSYEFYVNGSLGLSEIRFVSLAVVIFVIVCHICHHKGTGKAGEQYHKDHRFHPEDVELVLKNPKNPNRWKKFWIRHIFFQSEEEVDIWLFSHRRRGLHIPIRQLTADWKPLRPVAKLSTEWTMFKRHLKCWQAHRLDFNTRHINTFL